MALVTQSDILNCDKVTSVWTELENIKNSSAEFMEDNFLINSYWVWGSPCRSGCSSIPPKVNDASAIVLGIIHSGLNKVDGTPISSNLGRIATNYHCLILDYLVLQQSSTITMQLEQHHNYHCVTLGYLVFIQSSSCENSCLPWNLESLIRTILSIIQIHCRIEVLYSSLRNRSLIWYK